MEAERAKVGFGCRVGVRWVCVELRVGGPWDCLGFRADLRLVHGRGRGGSEVISHSV